MFETGLVSSDLSLYVILPIKGLFSIIWIMFLGLIVVFGQQLRRMTKELATPLSGLIKLPYLLFVLATLVIFLAGMLLLWFI